MPFPLSRLLRIGLFNLLIVALIGVTLRYKIAYSFPFIDQKNLLHGHSHFAFSGWVSHTLFTLMVSFLVKLKGADIYKRYRMLITGNLFAAYGMLFSFTLQGYGPVSITFSSFSILLSFLFTIRYWRDLNSIPNVPLAGLWFKAALVLNVLSTLGAFALTIMMVTKQMHQNWYLAAQYYYLHFQYNGWFFFGCLGLLMAWLPFQKESSGSLKKIFWLFFAASFPAFLLSVLWMELPQWLYILVIFSSMAQLVAWFWLLKIIWKSQQGFIKEMPLWAKWIGIGSAIAITIKFFLQAGSTIPWLSTLAFGFRPIVIGYLHLVFLGFVTLFFLWYLLAEKLINPVGLVRWGFYLFPVGVILNEVLLLIQGLASIRYILIPDIQVFLLFAAFLLCLSALFLITGKSTGLPPPSGDQMEKEA